MNTENHLITKMDDAGLSEHEHTVWKNIFTHDNKQITLWGEIDSKRNIDSISNQELPFIIEITDGEYNSAYKSKYGTDISVCDQCTVTVKPMPANFIRMVLSSSCGAEGLLKLLTEKNSNNPFIVESDQ